MSTLSEALDSIPGLSQPEQVLTFSVPVETFNDAVAAALQSAIRVSPAFQDWVEKTVRKFVAELAPESEHFQSVKAEVQKHLERYPALGSDPRLQDAVSKAILETMMKPVR